MPASRSSRRSPTSPTRCSWRSSARTTAPSASTRDSCSPRSSRASRDRSSRSRSTPPPAGRRHAWRGSRPAWPRTPISSSSGPINTGIEPGQMFNAIQNAMQANPDAIAIASVDCCSIVGAAKWAEQADRAGDIVIVGTDALAADAVVHRGRHDRLLDQPGSGRPGGHGDHPAARPRRRRHASRRRADAAARGQRRQRRHRSRPRDDRRRPAEPGDQRRRAQQALPGRRRARRRDDRRPRRRRDGGHGRERRRQVDADVDPGGPAAPGRRHRRRRRPAGRRLHAPTTSPTVTGWRWCPRS